MILSKNEIIKEYNNGNIVLENVKKEQIKDQSVDVSLGQYIYSDNHWWDISKGFYPPTNTLILAYTDEFIGTKAGSNILPSFKLKSTAGRQGILHTLAGHGEVGFFNRWAMEFILLNPIKIQEKMLIGQIYFTKTIGAENEDYSIQGNYQKYNTIEEIKVNWKKEDILPVPLKLK